jgi:hypothetical protein
MTTETLAALPSSAVTRTETIFVAPGNTQCRVYALPYALRPGQQPGDILEQYRTAWLEIGLLNAQLKLVHISPEYADLAEDIAGQMGGTYFAVERPVRLAPTRAPAYAPLTESPVCL